MNPYYQNQSCDPFVTAKPCDLGNYAVYSVNVTSKEDVVSAIAFAKEKNLRLVLQQKINGEGLALAVDARPQTVDVIEAYSSSTYSGAAVKIGPGIVAGEAYQVLGDAGYRIVGGEYASVSLAGGYTTGGGHSMLNTAYGMAVDNVLEWEVVTASGEYLVATPTENADLYWALSGGGGGTFAVVLSMITMIHADRPVAHVALTFNLTGSLSESSFWESIGLFFQQLPSLVSERNPLQFEILNNTFDFSGITVPDQNSTAVQTLVAPYLSALNTLNISYAFSYESSATFLDYFISIIGPLPYGPYPPTEIWVSRLVPLSLVHNSAATKQLVDAFKPAVADGTSCSAAMRKHPENAVFPGWRRAIAACSLTAFWDYEAALEENMAVKEMLVKDHIPAIEAAHRPWAFT
ncbi:putative FAD-binding PCMH-type domain-containing protein [Seiridium unicorne]|uniref:FAD-binding PCMH-type domain-containing protein n=1 Tax=Seiridium unicorne TaxID=138068 RepID=A0ABR2UVQ6_9PEZI